MNKNTATIAAILIALASFGGYFLWVADHAAMEMDHGDSHMTQTEQSPQIPQAEQIAALERQFITDMIPHHEEAMVSAQQVVDLGTNNAEVLKLAKGIVAAKKAEIILMKEWHATWYSEAYKDAGTYEPMMRDTAALSGMERDKAFLEDMIQHHLHAVAMVQDSAPQFLRPELKKLSQDIASSQSNEVVAMKILLRQL